MKKFKKEKINIFKKIVRISYSLFLALFIANMSYLGVFFVAPTEVKAADWPNCRFQCEAGDTEVKEFLLTDLNGDALTTCVPGTDVEAKIVATIVNNSNSDRKAVILLGDIYQGNTLIKHLKTNNVDGVCAEVEGGVIPGGEEVEADIYSFTWTCGENLTINNLNLSWGTGNNTCSSFFSSPACTNRTTKCYSQADPFVVVTPLVASFTHNAPQCKNEPVNFYGNATGGESPYTYSWDFDGDGNEDYDSQNPTHAFSSAGTHNVTLTVTDSDSNEDSHSENITVNECLTYYWDYSEWGNCDATCGSGEQTRTATCKDSNGGNASLDDCSSLNKEDLTKPCENLSACTSTHDCDSNALIPNSVFWRNGTTSYSYNITCNTTDSVDNCTSWTPDKDNDPQHSDSSPNIDNCTFRCIDGYGFEDGACIELKNCGNGKLDSGEQCDDGNTVDGDGCSATCQWETRNMDCSDKIANSVWVTPSNYTQTCGGQTSEGDLKCSDWSPTFTTVYLNESDDACQYKCDSNYYLENGVCVASPVVDNDPPIVNIETPEHEDIVSGIVDIYGTVLEDIELSHYNISIYPGGADFNDFSQRIYSDTVYRSTGFNNELIYTWDTTQNIDDSYLIRLAARDEAENIDLSCDAYIGGVCSHHVIEVEVNNANPVVDPLTTNFSHNYESQCLASESSIDIDFTASANGGDYPYTYLWDFDDGTTSTGATSTHSYTAAGTYDVFLTVTDDSEGVASTTEQIVISNCPQEDDGDSDDTGGGTSNTGSTGTITSTGGSTFLPFGISNPFVTAQCVNGSVIGNITWSTNQNANSRVVYDATSYAAGNLGIAPNYNYAYSTVTYPTNVTSHSVSISGLNQNSFYYLRPLSEYNGSEVVGEEVTLQTPLCSTPIVLGEEGAPNLLINSNFLVGYANPGTQDVSYEITVTNNGDITSFDTILNSILPTDLTFKENNSFTKNWNLGDINPGETKVITSMVNISTQADARTHVAVATTSSSNHDEVFSETELDIRRVSVLAETGFSVQELGVLGGIMGIVFSGIIALKREEVKIEAVSNK